MIYGFSKDWALHLKTKPRLAFQAFVNGTPQSTDWSMVLGRLATGRELAIHYFDEDVAKSLHQAIVQWGAFVIKFKESRRWEMTPELSADIADALDVTDQIQDQLTRKEFTLAFNNALQVEVKELPELLTPWEDYSKRRAEVLRKHGRKVLLRP